MKSTKPIIGILAAIFLMVGLMKMSNHKNQPEPAPQEQAKAVATNAKATGPVTVHGSGIRVEMGN